MGITLYELTMKRFSVHCMLRSDTTGCIPLKRFLPLFFSFSSAHSFFHEMVLFLLIWIKKFVFLLHLHRMCLYRKNARESFLCWWRSPTVPTWKKFYVVCCDLEAYLIIMYWCGFANCKWRMSKLNTEWSWLADGAKSVISWKWVVLALKRRFRHWSKVLIVFSYSICAGCA